MRKTFVPPPPMVEQAHLRSGPIERDGFDDYGIIFLTHPGVSANDIDTDQILGATIQNPKISGKNGLFTVMGGYFIEKSGSAGSRTVKISKIFGDALNGEKGFKLKNGSDQIIGDTWEVKDHSGSSRKELLDEREKGDNGWTFLVSYKANYRFYPPSLEPVNIFIDCPEIKVDKYTIRSNADKTEDTLTVDMLVTGGTVDEFTYDFGVPGSELKTSAKTAEYTYTRDVNDAKLYTITINSKASGGCTDDATFMIKIPKAPPVPDPCADLIGIEEVGREDMDDGKKVKVDFEAKVADPSVVHNSYTWEYGDGFTDENQGLTASHTYDKKTTPENYTVKVTGDGFQSPPDPCQDSFEGNVPIPALPVEPIVCPTIGTVTELSQKNISEGKTQFKLKAGFNGVAPSEFIWTYPGPDGELRKITQGPEVDIVLERAEKDREVIIRLDTSGPSECTGDSDICVIVPGKEVGVDCPWYMKAFPYLLAFLFTMLISAVLTCYLGVDKAKLINLDAAQDHLYNWAIGMAFLTIILGFIWAVLGRKSKCGPRLCNILMILTTGMIGTSVYSLLVGNCFDNGPTLTFIVFLLLGAGGVFYYNKSCKGKMTGTQIAIFALMGVLAVIIAVMYHANSTLQCMHTVSP